MSRSPIYLFTSQLPITAANVTASMQACDDLAYFLAVPYVLKMLAEDETARRNLASLDMVR